MEDASASPPASYSQRARRLAAVAERRRLNVLRAAASPRHSSPTRTSPSRRPGSPPRASPKKTGGSLAYALQQASCQWDGSRLSAPSLGITSIGPIPDCYKAATALYLGRNALASLEGLQQFPALTTLSLADNQLQQVADISMLAVACPALVSLAVEGNPLSRLPHARAHVLVQLPQLQQLDGVVVRPRDREAAAAAVKQEESCMALMVSNACVVHKLVRQGGGWQGGRGMGQAAVEQDRRGCRTNILEYVVRLTLLGFGLHVTPILQQQMGVLIKAWQPLPLTGCLADPVLNMLLYVLPTRCGAGARRRAAAAALRAAPRHAWPLPCPGVLGAAARPAGCAQAAAAVGL